MRDRRRRRRQRDVRHTRDASWAPADRALSRKLSVVVPSVVNMNEPVVVDCDTCLVRSAAACGDCVVTVLLGAPPDGVVLAETEVTALDVLAREGLVPPLRMVTPLTSPDVEAS